MRNTARVYSSDGYSCIVEEGSAGRAEQWLAAFCLLENDVAHAIHTDMVGQPLITVSKLSRAGLFDLAITTAQMLSVDMTELFQRLTVCCIKLSAASDPSM